MSKYFILLSVLLFATGSVIAQTPDLYMSEYIEGSANNKAIELFNGTPDAISLNGYSIVLYFNGNPTGTSINLDPSVTLETGDTFVITHTSATAALLGLANQTSGSMSFNGDDVIILEKDGEVIDSMGILGVDPGSAWSCADGNTANHTLRRKSDVCQGDTDETDPYDICAEWNFFATNTFDGIGSHETDCSTVSNESGDWGALKAIYR